MIIPYFELYSVSVKLGSRFITKIATWSRVFWWEIMQVENTKERFGVCNVGAAYKFIGTWLWMSTKQCWNDQNTSDCWPSCEQKKKFLKQPSNLLGRDRVCHWKSVWNDSQLNEWILWLWVWPEKEQFAPNTIQLFAKSMRKDNRWLPNDFKIHAQEC